MTTMETISGRPFDLLDPRAEQVHLADIAHALARINRFTGHTAGERGYSVAEHALHVCALVERDHGDDPVLCALALHHDAHEAYTGDVSAPLKAAIRQWTFIEFRRCEALGTVVAGGGGAGGAAAGATRSPLDLIERAVQAQVLTALGLPEPTPAQRAIVKRADLIALAAERSVFLPGTGALPWACLEGLPIDAGTVTRLRSQFFRSAVPNELAQLYRARSEVLRGRQ